MAQIDSCPPNFPSDLQITTTEMHVGGEYLRVIESGYPEPKGATILEKCAWLSAHAEAYRKMVMFEPRGHYDIFGALLVPTDLPGADLGVVFISNEGFATMCGIGVIALGRYAVDRGLVPKVSPETRVVVQCPCGPVTAHVTCKDNVTSDVRFTSIPCYVFALDYEVDVPELGKKVTVDICFGGNFYAMVPDHRLGLNLSSFATSELAHRADAVTKALRTQVKLHHPDSPDLAFVYGTIVTDGGDEAISKTDNGQLKINTNLCIFADKQVDRSSCGSGVSARVALQYQRKSLALGQKRRFRAGITGSELTGSPMEEVKIKGAGLNHADVVGVRLQVSGHPYYIGKSTFTVEADDPFRGGFLVRQ